MFKTRKLSKNAVLRVSCLLSSSLRRSHAAHKGISSLRALEGYLHFLKNWAWLAPARGWITGTRAGKIPPFGRCDAPIPAAAQLDMDIDTTTKSDSAL
jgi:hypothetical protein